MFKVRVVDPSTVLFQFKVYKFCKNRKFHGRKTFSRRIFDLIGRAEQRGVLQLVIKGMMLEADVFLCEYQRMRVNFYFDFAGGAYVKTVEPISLKVMEEMRRTLEAI